MAEGETSDGDRKRPPSVKEVLGAPRPVSSSASSPSEAGKAREEGEGDGRGGRPTPVREMMGPEAVGEAARIELPRRTFEREGEAWAVTMVGTTVTGAPRDPGAPLMHLHFSRAETPDEPLRELLCVGRGLDRLFEEELRELLERSRPLEER